jgi:hypothetical protein
LVDVVWLDEAVKSLDYYVLGLPVRSWIG